MSTSTEEPTAFERHARQDLSQESNWSEEFREAFGLEDGTSAKAQRFKARWSKVNTAQTRFFNRMRTDTKCLSTDSIVMRKFTNVQFEHIQDTARLSIPRVIEVFEFKTDPPNLNFYIHSQGCMLEEGKDRTFLSLHLVYAFDIPGRKGTDGSRGSQNRRVDHRIAIPSSGVRTCDKHAPDYEELWEEGSEME